MLAVCFFLLFLVASFTFCSCSRVQLNFWVILSFPLTRSGVDWGRKARWAEFNAQMLHFFSPKFFSPFETWCQLPCHRNPWMIRTNFIKTPFCTDCLKKSCAKCFLWKKKVSRLMVPKAQNKAPRNPRKFTHSRIQPWLRRTKAGLGLVMVMMML